MSDKEIVFQAINKYADGFVVNILNKPVRFGEDDVNQLVEIFKTFKQNN